MHLRDLDAQFVGHWSPDRYQRLESVEGAQGLLFQCPKCAVGKEAGEEEGRRFFRGAHYILCWFLNPRNAPQVPDDIHPGPGRWRFTGDTISTITFVGPSAASVFLQGSRCQWHGFVKNGTAE